MTRTQSQKIIQIWQPVGYSTYQITIRAAQKFGVKTAHTGVLDPLAEGVILVLLDDERLKKEEYSKWKKEYEFEMAFGIATDSYDGMGLVEGLDFSKRVEEKVLARFLSSLKGKYTQEVPLYSAVKVKGKKLFFYPKEGLPTPKLPKKTGEIYKIEFLSLKEEKLEKLIEKTISNVQTIKGGEFRQDQIVSGWENFLSLQKMPQKIQIAKIRVKTSSGIYIRSLSQDIAIKLNSKAFITRLARTKNGKYAKKDCKTIKKVFGSSVNNNDFVSRFMS